MAAKMESLALRPTQIQNGAVSAWGLEGADKARAFEAAATLDGRPHAGAKQLAGVATNLGKVGALLRAREGHPRVVEETAMKRRRHHRGRGVAPA